MFSSLFSWTFFLYIIGGIGTEPCDGPCCNLYNRVFVRGLCLECPTGKFGFNCTDNCPDNFYGKNCLQKCYTSCTYTHYCNPVNGCMQRKESRDCPKGKHGPGCSKNCLQGFHGVNCTELCSCKEDEYCDSVDGCLNFVATATVNAGNTGCPADRHGPGCSSFCPSNFYGPDCLQECKCKNDEYCHLEAGCTRRNRPKLTYSPSTEKLLNLGTEAGLPDGQTKTFWMEFIITVATVGVVFFIGTCVLIACVLKQQYGISLIIQMKNDNTTALAKDTNNSKARMTQGKVLTQQGTSGESSLLLEVLTTGQSREELLYDTIQEDLDNQAETTNDYVDAVGDAPEGDFHDYVPLNEDGKISPSADDGYKEAMKKENDSTRHSYTTLDKETLPLSATKKTSHKTIKDSNVFAAQNLKVLTTLNDAFEERS